MIHQLKWIGFILFVLPLITQAQNQENQNAFTQASQSIQQQLEASVAELNQLREQAANKTIPLSRELNKLESELTDIRAEFQNTTRLLDSHTLDLSNLRTEMNTRQEESAYLSNLLSEYIRNFESRLHIAELQRYSKPLEVAKLAAENSGLPQHEIFQAQSNLLSVSIDRLNEALGGMKFEGTAVDDSGLVKQGNFMVLGPVALFRSDDGQVVGTAEQRLGSLEPAVIPFNNPVDAEAAAALFNGSGVSGTGGAFPLDPTLGNAHKMAETEETLVEHIQKGGPVMYPIFALAAVCLLVSFYKWIGISLTRIPSRKKIKALLADVARRDQKAALEKTKKMRGPVGRMLSAGVEHLHEPRELMEEVMYEEVLKTRLKLERFLPFIAIGAAAAPLLGLLGTVTGIINTFKLITVFGSGDVKSLSGGISEALITTEYGLIVAIPSLLIHALLSRKARGVVNEMEKAAVALINENGKSETHHKEHKADKPKADQPMVTKDLDGGLPALESSY